MILCVTPNPALDRTLVLPELRRGEVLRPSEVIVAAGGKGLNVARCLGALGGEARCVGPLGGHNGRLFADLAAQEGIKGVWTWTESETRTCTIIVEANGESTGIYEHGQPLDANMWARFCDDTLQAARSVNAVCLCGSLPPGVTPAMVTDLIAALGATGAPVWVDTSGPALEAAIAARPYGLKINADEASALLGVSIVDAESALIAATDIRKAGVATVVLTLGGSGAVMLDAEGAWVATPPPIHVRSAVGSGDAFLAGLLHAASTGRISPEALRLAIATGAANAATHGVGQFSASVVAKLVEATGLTVQKGIA